MIVSAMTTMDSVPKTRGIGKAMGNLLAFPICLATKPSAKHKPSAKPSKSARGKTEEQRSAGGRPLTISIDEGRGWAIAGLVFLLCAVWFLETASPYYFCQDDNLATTFPDFIFACRSVWNGKIPEYSPYNFVGCPLLAKGMGETFPPLYASYAIARHILGDECATMDVLAIGDLIVAYFAMYLLMRHAGMRGMVACVGALSYTLSGCVLVMGRSWFTFMSGIAISPLLVLAVERLRDGPTTWRWPVVVGLLIGLYYHVGFPQLWIYGMMFFALHAAGLWATKAIPFRRALQIVPALLLGIAISLPLFYPQWRLAHDLPVEEGYGEGIGRHLISFVLPYPLYQGTLPNEWGEGLDTEYGCHFFYNGTLMPLLFLIALGDWAAQTFGWIPRRRSSHVWTFCALFAFILCIGRYGLLWQLLSHLSTGLKNHPFRVMPFLTLFSVLSASAMLERLLSRFPKRSAVDLGVAVVAGGLLVHHVVACSLASFYTYGFHPYPPLPKDMVQLLQSPEEPAPYRHLFYAGERSITWTYPYSMPHSLPTYYELPGMLGYDPIYYRKSSTRAVIDRVLADPNATLAAYGVRWLLPDPYLTEPYLPGGPKAADIVENTLCDALLTVPILRYHKFALPRNAVMHVCEVKRPSPLAFRTDAPDQALPLTMDSEGVYVDLAAVEGGRSIVVNFLHWPDMRAYVDGRPTPIEHDEWNRMVIQTPSDAKKLAVLYQSPWWPGTAAGGVCLLAALCGMVVLRERKAPKPAIAG